MLWFRLFLAGFFILLFSVSASAQGTLDYQSRFLVHMRRIEPNKPVGLAAWLVVPDAMRGERTQALVLVGPALRCGPRCVAEILGGSFVGASQEGIVDVRITDTRFARLDGWLEVAHLFKTNRTLINPAVVTPLAVGSFRFKLGGEYEVFLKPGKNTASGGPRFVVPLKQWNGKTNLLLGGALHFKQGGGAFFRSYLVFNF